MRIVIVGGMLLLWCFGIVRVGWDRERGVLVRPVPDAHLRARLGGPEQRNGLGAHLEPKG